MAEAWQNPYAPGTATAPPVLTGRDDWLGRFDDYFRGLVSGRPIQHVCFWGPRGMGKTVLLERLGQMGRERGVAARRVEATADATFADALARELGALGGDLASRGPAWRRLRAAVDDVTLTLGGGPVKAEIRARPTPLDQVLAELLVRLGELARDRKGGALLLLDEIQAIDPAHLRAVARGLQSCAAAALPVLMVAGGLPQAPEHIRRAVTYGERYRYAELGPLNPVAVRVALEEPAAALGVTFEPAALDGLVAASQGYPYLVQLLGHRCWEAARGGPVITGTHARVAVPAALSELAGSVFDGRFTRITPTERAYVEALAALGDGPVAGGDVAAALGRTPQSLSRTRQSLIDKGLIAPVGSRQLVFTLPHFASYVRSRSEPPPGLAEAFPVPPTPPRPRR
ncbi:MAG: AAA family ATPase [Acidimicrobiia bacterium]